METKSAASRKFTKNWLNEPEQRLHHLSKFVGHPINVLEIGVHEGRSTCWMFDHIATHEEARLITVDPFGYVGGSSEAAIEVERFDSKVWGKAEEIERRYFENTAEFSSRFMHHRLTSDQFFKSVECKPGHFSIIVVDGGHSAPQAAKDLLHSWDLLAHGGMLVFDDYKWNGDRDWKCDGPKRAMDAFLSIIPVTDYRIAYKGYIVILEKL